MANLLLERPSPSTAESQPSASSVAASSTLAPASPSTPSATRSLPYCAIHQAEFLSLQAEAEALFHQLQTLAQLQGQD